MITRIIKADGTEVVPGKDQYIEERGKCVELFQRDEKDPDLYHRVKRWYRQHILWIFYDALCPECSTELEHIMIKTENVFGCPKCKREVSYRNSIEGKKRGGKRLEDIIEPKFRVVWEERRYTFVHAKNREEAELLVRNGEFDQVFSEEITVQPEADKVRMKGVRG